MRSNIRLLLTFLLVAVLVAPIIWTTHAAQQSPQAPAQPFDQFVNRISDGLKLSEQQAGEFRKILANHAPKLLELRNRAQATPYAPGLQAEADKEQKGIREQLSELLDEDQKGKLASIDFRPLVPLGQPFVLINILPHVRIEAGTVKLASAERLIPAPIAAAKGRTGRLTDDQRLLHLLNRITFGPHAGDLARVKQAGIDRFIEEQLHPETIDDSDLEKRLEVLPTQRLASTELYQYYPPPQVAEQRANDRNAQPVFGRPQQVIGELVQQKLVRAVSSNRQLQEVLTDFWFNHFNVFAQKEADQWLVTSYERDVIRPRALGKFRDLLLATAESPAMLFYLDNWLSTSPASKLPRPPAPPRPQNGQPPRPAPGATPKPPDAAGPGDNSAMMAKKEGEPNPQSAIRNPQSTDPNPAVTPKKEGQPNPQSATRNPQSTDPNPAATPKKEGQPNPQSATRNPQSTDPNPAATPKKEGEPNSQSAIRNPQSTDPNPAVTPKKEGEQNPQSAIRNPQSPPRPPARKPGINENYARELMELHTLGVDGGYTQKDVQEVARCFTGWTIDRPSQGGGFVFRPWMHDDGVKTVLGVTIPAGGGVTDGLRVIDILARHPSTARFISKKLCQRFVSDDPPAQLVERVSQVFLKTDGDIREVIRAIVTSPEFNSPAAFRAKIKSPLELAASAIRALDGDTNGAPALHEWVRRMGEPLYQFAFPTGYGEDSAKWVNTGVFFNRINYAVAVANNQINGTSYDPMRLVSSEAAANPDELTNQLSALIVHTELSAESLRAVRAGLSQQTQAAAQPGAARPAMNTGERPEMIPVRATPADTNPERRRIAQIIGLLMGTAEFQRR